MFKRLLVNIASFPFGGGTPYSVLGISPFASDAELKRAYHRLMRQHHPDMLAAPHSHASAINAAYEVITKQRGLKKLAA